VSRISRRPAPEDNQLRLEILPHFITLIDRLNA